MGSNTSAMPALTAAIAERTTPSEYAACASQRAANRRTWAPRRCLNFSACSCWIWWMRIVVRNFPRLRRLRFRRRLCAEEDKEEEDEEEEEEEDDDDDDDGEFGDKGFDLEDAIAADSVATVLRRRMSRRFARRDMEFARSKVTTDTRRRRSASAASTTCSRTRRRSSSSSALVIGRKSEERQGRVKQSESEVKQSKVE